MNTETSPHARRLCVALFALIAAGISTPARAVVSTIADNFNTSHNYLSSGVAGTIWDGVYTGAGSFPGGNISSPPGTTFVADANVTAPGRLTVQSADGGWDANKDDGFFLFKNVSGDFRAEVHIVSPFNATPFNMGGLMVRAAGPGGAPSGPGENWVWLTHFSEFSIGNYVESTVNNVTTQFPVSSAAPDLNYWLRIDRVSDAFFFYQKAQDSDPWQLLGSSPVVRNDLAGLALQVGIIQQDFNSTPGTVQFDDFILTVPEPGAGALLGSGLFAGLVWSRARRRARSADSHPRVSNSAALRRRILIGRRRNLRGGRFAGLILGHRFGRRFG